MYERAVSPYFVMLLKGIPGKLVYISTHTVQSMMCVIDGIHDACQVVSVHWHVKQYTCISLSSPSSRKITECIFTYTLKHAAELVNVCWVYSVKSSMFCRLSLSQYARLWLKANPFLFWWLNDKIGTQSYCHQIDWSYFSLAICLLWFVIIFWLFISMVTGKAGLYFHSYRAVYDACQ